VGCRKGRREKINSFSQGLWGSPFGETETEEKFKAGQYGDRGGSQWGNFVSEASPEIVSPIKAGMRSGRA